MDMPRIDSGIPSPPVQERRASSRYPWRQMKVGDSFFVANDFRSLPTSGTKAALRLGIKLVSRREGDGRRFFRIA